MIALRVYQKEVLLVSLSAILASLPFHDPRFAPLAWIALVPLFCALERLGGRGEAALFGYFWGVLFFGATLYWVLHVTIIGFIALLVFLGCYGALFAFLCSRSVAILANSGSPHFRYGWLNVLSLAALWVLVEYLRFAVPVMKFPWALIGYTQWKTLPMIQIADWTGPYGVSFVVAAVNAAIFGALAAVRRLFKYELSFAAGLVQIAVMAAVAGSLFAGAFFYGRQTLKTFPLEEAPNPWRIAVVQGNIPQHEKWDASIKDMIFEKYEGLSRQAALERPDLVVWPETAFPGYWEDEPRMQARFQSIVRDVGSRFLIGSPTILEEDGVQKRMNTALYFGPKGERLGAYHKLRLVPFGEYVPFFTFLRRFFEIGRFSPGSAMVLFTLPGSIKGEKDVLFSVLICFEDIFPDLCRSLVSKGSRVLINITNDAWFLKSSAPYQHAQASVFRAVENRVPVVRAANTGLSCWIDPLGRIRDTVKDKGGELFITGVRTWPITLGPDKRTFYNQWGDVFVALSLALFVLIYPLYKNPHNLIRTESPEGDD